MALIIGLSGVDGSGKTTIALAVTEKLRASGRSVSYHHEIDFMLLRPMFSFVSRLAGKKVAENVRENLVVSAEHGRPLLSDIYYIAVWLDNLFSFLYFKLKRGIVIHDRWLYDFTTFFEHKHYTNGLVKKLYYGFPRPDVYILLTVPEEVAYQRKQGEIAHEHHDLEYYREMAALALGNARRWHCDGIIRTDGPVEQAVDEVLAVIGKAEER